MPTVSPRTDAVRRQSASASAPITAQGAALQRLCTIGCRCVPKTSGFTHVCIFSVTSGGTIRLDGIHQYDLGQPSGRHSARRT